MEKIDFVITWVDGEDSAWIEEKSKYSGMDSSICLTKDANNESRYRELGFLKYWFRGVEKFATWVNKIHFVTCGQKPDWLVDNHPKLNFVNHRDFIPEEYLPTFNSNTIELNLHRIKDLSERFVLFNDDTFLLQFISAEFYFKQGLPVLVSTLKFPKYFSFDNIRMVMFHNYCIVNNHFNIAKSIKRNRSKWFDAKALGIREALKNYICYKANGTLLPVGDFGHLPQPHLKSTFEDVWDNEFETMHRSCMYKFRDNNQVNHWLLCAWNQAKGCFSPAASRSRGNLANLDPKYIDYLVKTIISPTIPQLCINDSYRNTDPELTAHQVIDAFERLCPEKSSFEK